MNSRLPVYIAIFLVATGVSGFSSTAVQAECLDYSTYMHVTGALPAEARFLDQMGDHVYVSSMQVIDVSVSGVPAVVGDFEGESGDVRGIKATATHLYVIYSAADGAGFNGLAIYDLANPAAPAKVGVLALPQFMTQMRIVGDRAYLRNDQGRLTIADISDPSAPLAMGNIGQNWLDSFDLNGNFLYAVDRLQNDIAVINVTDGNSLQVDFRLAMSDIISISFDNGYGYFLHATQGTKVFTFSAPDQFTMVNSLPDIDRPLVIRGAMAYSYGNPMNVYGLSDASSPDLVVSVPFVIHDGIMDGDRALVGLSNNFAEMDLSNTSALPALAGTLDVPSTLTAMLNSGDIMVTLSRTGLDTYDTSDCANPSLLGGTMWQEQVVGQAWAGDYFYVLTAGQSSGQVTLVVYDLTDPTMPTQVATKSLFGDLTGLTAVGDYLYSNEFGGMLVLDVSDPLNPRQFSRTPGLGFSEITAVSGSNMFVVDGTMLRHFDVSSPSNPQLVSSANTDVDGTSLAVGGGAVYVAHRDGVVVYDMTSMAKLNELTVPGVVDGIALGGKTLYAEGSGVFMFDVTDPSLALMVGNLAYIADRSDHLMVVGDCVYTHQYISGDSGRVNIAATYCSEDGPGGGDTVVIDIKPGSDINPINCHSKQGVIPVAILTTDGFDALSVDHATVRFGNGEAREAHTKKRGGQGRGRNGGHDNGGEIIKRHVEDVDGDGDMDLVFHFRKEAAEIACGDTEAWLTGETFDGVSFRASDVVTTGRGNGGGKGNNKSQEFDAPAIASEPLLSMAPNPFNPATTIFFSLPESQQLRIEVYAISGRRVAVLAEGVYPAGPSQIVWQGSDDSGRNVASGVYFVRMTGRGVELSQRAVLLK
ncbi:MAG: hypothetical protein ACI9UQ_001128 [Candidatus Krumholzibacteriia bacterium]|jgi:hypothetical protein